MPTADAYDRRQRVHDALDGVRHTVPRDLARDVAYYLDSAQEPELALDVLIDGIIDGRVLLSLDEFERLQHAMEACGRFGDRRLSWLEEHGMRPLAPSEDESET